MGYICKKENAVEERNSYRERGGAWGSEGNILSSNTDKRYFQRRSLALTRRNSSLTFLQGERYNAAALTVGMRRFQGC
ncbi:hypothetical protein K0M31_001329 [Melipona bicolor]|uniref:Uncharacterized protein n=1 Tax=Melipona bicolor TaxID=60889 RepID=A0AA40GFC1_9HYME|nr:hypothetical protein K0M31_001329 [Melipona bicolor]